MVDKFGQCGEVFGVSCVVCFGSISTNVVLRVVRLTLYVWLGCVVLEFIGGVWYVCKVEQVLCGLGWVHW